MSKINWYQDSGTNLMIIVDCDENPESFIVTEDDLIDMVRLAFDVGWFGIDDLIDIFQRHEKEEPK